MSWTTPALSPGMLVAACFVLAFTNFMVVLDTTIANVSVAHIAGGLGISSSEGTWVITSYAVAEAICVPLTGWLTRRFGTICCHIQRDRSFCECHAKRFMISQYLYQPE